MVPEFASICQPPILFLTTDFSAKRDTFGGIETDMLYLPGYLVLLRYAPTRISASHHGKDHKPLHQPVRSSESVKGQGDWHCLFEAQTRSTFMELHLLGSAFSNGGQLRLHLQAKSSADSSIPDVALLNSSPYMDIITANGGKTDFLVLISSSQPPYFFTFAAQVSIDELLWYVLCLNHTGPGRWFLLVPREQVHSCSVTPSQTSDVDLTRL